MLKSLLESLGYSTDQIKKTLKKQWQLVQSMNIGGMTTEAVQWQMTLTPAT